MKKIYSSPKIQRNIFFILVLFLFIISIYLYQSYVIKQRTMSMLNADVQKVTMYTKWGYDTKTFEKIYAGFIRENQAYAFFLFPARVKSIQNKHDSILLLIQAGYATEVSKQKGLVQSRLSYLRERVKNSSFLVSDKKNTFSNIFEIVAGDVFEKNGDLNDLKKAIRTLEEEDMRITKEVETVRKEALMGELREYKNTCEALLRYFIEKNSRANQELTQECIIAADKLMGSGYAENGADFIETLSRERVFTQTQKAAQAKQQIIQDEQYAKLAKEREEEKLSLVPPPPRQEGKIIVVNLGLQRLYAYENGKTLFPIAIPITTGKRGFETVTGEFAIYLKELHHQMVSPFPGIYYDDIVNYWMPFYLGYGLHDAPWRSVYGAQDYSAVGSHGCVNMPLKDATVLYNWAEVGTRVIVL